MCVLVMLLRVPMVTMERSVNVVLRESTERRYEHNKIHKAADLGLNAA